MGRLTRVLVIGLAVVLGGGCGSAEEHADLSPVDEPAITTTSVADDCVPSDSAPVDASQVVIHGALTSEQAQMVAWALERFRRGGTPAPG